MSHYTDNHDIQEKIANQIQEHTSHDPADDQSQPEVEAEENGDNCEPHDIQPNCEPDDLKELEETLSDFLRDSYTDEEIIKMKPGV